MCRLFRSSRVWVVRACLDKIVIEKCCFFRLYHTTKSDHISVVKPWNEEPSLRTGTLFFLARPESTHKMQYTGLGLDGLHFTNHALISVCVCVCVSLLERGAPIGFLWLLCKKKQQAHIWGKIHWSFLLPYIMMYRIYRGIKAAPHNWLLWNAACDHGHCFVWSVLL